MSLDFSYRHLYYFWVVAREGGISRAAARLGMLSNFIAKPVLRGFALAQADALVQGVQQVAAQAPWRHMLTPGGQAMSVAMTGCGPLSWVSDRRGYRYAERDPASGQPWPAMPAAFMRLAQDAARQAGFAPFLPDACLINRYAPGARMSLHQDRDERDLAAPIVSVSLGLPAVFLWGGATRSERALRVPLRHEIGRAHV